MKKRVLSLIIALALVVTMIPESVVKAEEISHKKFIGTARFGSDTYTNSDFNLTYYYDDAYFTNSSYEKNISLTTMSLVTAMAAGRSNEASNHANKSQNIKKLWQDCGFSKIEVNEDFKNPATKTSTALGCASKKLEVDGESYTLISFAISGLRVSHEWGGGYYMGRTGDCQSMREGADKAYTFLKKYISEKGIKGKIKVWMTGYFAAGAKVNLLAADLDNGKSLGGAVSLNREDIYAYCFNAPAITLRSNAVTSGKYKNIFVYNDPYNYVTHFCPARYDFDLYGSLNEFPTRQEDTNYYSKREKMLRMLRTIDGAPNYLLDNFRNKEFSLLGEGNMKDSSTDLDANKYLDVAIDALCLSCAPTRDDYVNDFQEDLADLMDFIQGSDDPNWYKVTDYFGQELTDHILSVGVDILLGNESSLAKRYEEYAYTAMEKAHVSADSTRVKTFATTLAKVAVKYAKSYTNYCVTLFANFDILLQGVEATFSLAWLESMDPNYSEDGKNMAFCTATPSESKYVYSGNALKPSVIVKNGDTTLTKGTDYTVSYENNTEIGTGYIVVNGLGDYTGTLKVPFSIIPGKTSLKLSNISSGIKVSWTPVVGSKGYYIYRKAGSESAWSKVKTITNGETKSWTDKSVIHNKKYVYSIIAYAGSKKGSRSGSKTYYYLKKITLSSAKADGKKAILVKWKSSSGITGYQVSLSMDADFNFASKKSYAVEKKLLAAKITKLKSGKTYYFRVRSIRKVGKTQYYGAWSNVKKAKTN